MLRCFTMAMRHGSHVGNFLQIRKTKAQLPSSQPCDQHGPQRGGTGQIVSKSKLSGFPLEAEV